MDSYCCWLERVTGLLKDRCCSRKYSDQERSDLICYVNAKRKKTTAAANTTTARVEGYLEVEKFKNTAFQGRERRGRAQFPGSETLRRIGQNGRLESPHGQRWLVETAKLTLVGLCNGRSVSDLCV